MGDPEADQGFLANWAKMSVMMQVGVSVFRGIPSQMHAGVKYVNFMGSWDNSLEIESDNDDYSH